MGVKDLKEDLNYWLFESGLLPVWLLMGLIIAVGEILVWLGSSLILAQFQGNYFGLGTVFSLPILIAILVFIGGVRID